MNYLKILVPIVAILVIGESIILFSGMTKRKNQEVIPTTGNIPLIPSGVSVKADFGLVFRTDQSQMKVGKPSIIMVDLLAKSTKSLDSLILYVKYDSKSFNISNLTFDPKLPKPSFSKVSTIKNMIVVNFLIPETTGMQINKGDTLNLVTFEAIPKVAGSFSFEISTGNGTNESATMFVENATAKALPYLESKLTVKAIK